MPEEKLPPGFKRLTPAVSSASPVPSVEGLPAGFKRLGGAPSAWEPGDIGQQFDQTPAPPAAPALAPEDRQPGESLLAYTKRRVWTETPRPNPLLEGLGLGAAKAIPTTLINLGQLGYQGLSKAQRMIGGMDPAKDLANRQAFLQAKGMFAPEGAAQAAGMAGGQLALTSLPMLASGGAAAPAAGPQVANLATSLGRIASTAGKGALWGGGTEAAMTGEVTPATGLAAGVGAVPAGTGKALGEGWKAAVDTRTIDRLKNLVAGSDLTKSILMKKDTLKALLPFTPRSIRGGLKASEMVEPVASELGRLGGEINAIAARAPATAIVNPNVMLGSLNKFELVTGPGSKSYVGPLLKDVAGNLKEKTIQTGDPIYHEVGRALLSAIKKEDPMDRAARLTLGLPRPQGKPMTIEQALIARRALDERLTYGPPKVFKTGEQASDSKVTQQIGHKMREELDKAMKEALPPADRAKFEELNKAYSDLVPGIGILEKRAAEQAQSPSLLTRTLDSINIVGRFYGPMTRVIIR